MVIWNVTVSTLGKLQDDGTRYYDSAVQFDNHCGIHVKGSGSAAEMTASDGNNVIYLENAPSWAAAGVSVDQKSSFRAQALNGDNIFTIKPDPAQNMSTGIVVEGRQASTIEIAGINNILRVEGTAYTSAGNTPVRHVVDVNGNTTITAEKDNSFLMKDSALGHSSGLICGSGGSGTNSELTVTAKTGNNTVYLDPSSPDRYFTGVYTGGTGASVILSAPQGENRIVAKIDSDAARQTLAKYGLSSPEMASFDGVEAYYSHGRISLEAQRNIIEIFPVQFGSRKYSYQARGISMPGYSGSQINLTAQQDNIVRAGAYGYGISLAYADNCQVNLEAVHGDNIMYGEEYGIYGDNGADDNSIRLHTAEGNNSVTSEGTAIEISRGSEVNIVADAGDNIVSGKNYGAAALRNAQITIDSPQGTNYISSDGTAVDIRSGDTAQITISGQTVIEGKEAALKLEKDQKTWSGETSTGGTIQVNYAGSSSITGDVYGMNGGTVNITPQSRGAMTITGNIFGADESVSLDEFDATPGFEFDAAGNVYTLATSKAWAKLIDGGTANVELSAGSRLVGRADTGRRYAKTLLEKRKATFDEKMEEALQKFGDDRLAYQESMRETYGQPPMTDEEKAQYMENWETQYSQNYRNTYFNKDRMFEQFEDDAADAAGEVNIMLNDGALWDMTGPSSVTTLGGSGGTVYYENGGDSLEIGTLSGSHTFAMDLDADDGSNSDMLYINEGTSDEQTLVVKNLATLDSQMDDGEAVRFATISNSQNEFRDGKTIGYSTYGIYRDAFTVEYRDVATDPLNTDAYNEAYNGDTTDGIRKPTTADVTTYYLDGYDDPQNVYLVKSVVDVDDGAVTPERNRDLVWRYVTDLDTFTKRDGQAQYFTDEGKRGGWVRFGYRNLGVDDVGELDGNTYELGWTTISRQNDERKHRFSASVAYGKPKGHFEGYGGDLTVRDFSVNLYDTHEYYPSAKKLAQKPAWKKDSHAYWDNYLKYHHVKTEYDAYDHVVGTEYSGDYSQNVWNLSTEYGHKLMMNEDWFWVPQAQLQLSYFGGYDYVDSQGLHIDGDHDWSLLGRLGFDVVRNLDEKTDSKLYLKASLLHEFLDGNDVTVRYGSDRYVHEGDQSGTWGVVGLGYSSKIGDKQYFYLDAERYFGNDFSRTYDIKAGVNWKF
ncbi:MAG: hypothetical protein ACFWT7_01070 [Succiniclasticum sp.]|jgi:outer membrane autotransporter protein